MRVVVSRSRFPMKRKKHETEHVDCCEERGHARNGPQPRMAVRKRLVKDLVLAEEAGQAGHARNRQRADQKRPVRDGQFGSQPSHPAQVLLTRQRMNYRTRSEEQQRLEERVREEMEDTGGVCTDA